MVVSPTRWTLFVVLLIYCLNGIGQQVNNDLFQLDSIGDQYTNIKSIG
ncbi:hypothetical protein O9992_14635 [Vibrio lentus]|nr:hypothetical protein [Vibrio lentus]